MWGPSRQMPDCPLRPGEACTLCAPGATGPADCPTVAEVKHHPQLLRQLAELHHEVAESA